MKSVLRRLREPSTHSALAVAGVGLLPVFGVGNDITIAVATVLAAFGVILPEGGQK